VKDYTVVIAYTGECCTDSHVWVKHVRAESELQAVIKMRRLVIKDGNAPQDAAVFPGKLPAALVMARRDME
jgi:hypothetical protein